VVPRADASIDRVDGGSTLTAAPRASSVEEIVRIAAMACALILWSTYAYMVWTPAVLDRAGSVKGWDFPQFYASGWLAANGRKEALADGSELGRVATSTISPVLATSRIVPVYGPQVGLLFAPFGALRYTPALILWVGLTLAIYVFCCLTIWRRCRALQGRGATVGWAAAGSPALFLVVCYGQISALALGLFTLAYVALARRRPIAAGLALGSLVYKPQLGLAVALVFLAAREWRIIAGAVMAGAAQLGVALTYAGHETMQTYVNTLRHLDDNVALVQEKKHLLQSLLSFWELSTADPLVTAGAYACSAVAVLVACWIVWRSNADLGIRFSALLISTVLVSPHCYVYDLLILAPAGFFLADRALALRHGWQRMVMGACLALLYAVPLVSAFSARAWGFQPTPVILSALMALVTRDALSRRLPPRSSGTVSNA
jgi:hypothetical protein